MSLTIRRGLDLRVILSVPLLIILFFIIAGKYECTIPRVAVITNPDSRPPGSGCNEGDRISQFSKKFTRPKVAEQVLGNLMKDQVSSKRRIFYVKDLISVLIKDGKLNLSAIEYLAKNYQVGIGFLTELFTNLISCGYLDGKTVRPNFEDILKRHKKPLPKPQIPDTKPPKIPKTPKDYNQFEDDFHMW